MQAILCVGVEVIQIQTRGLLVQPVGVCFKSARRRYSAVHTGGQGGLMDSQRLVKKEICPFLFQREPAGEVVEC